MLNDSMYMKHVEQAHAQRRLVGRGEGNNGQWARGPLWEDERFQDEMAGVDAPRWDCTKCHWSVRSKNGELHVT